MSRPAPPAPPVALTEVEIGDLPGGPAPAAVPGRPGRTRCLVRVHGRPEGEIEVESGPGGATRAALVEAAWAQLASRLARHLQNDGLPADPTAGGAAPSGPDRAPGAARPACLARRDALLAGPPFASVVVATRDRPGLLARCLGSLAVQDYPGRFEVVVVDSAATVPAGPTVAGMRGDGLDLHYVVERRPGLAVAHNRGLETVGGKIVAFLDDDVRADPQWLSEVVAAFRDVPGAGCVTGMILPSELDTAPQQWLDRHWAINKGFDRRVFDRVAGAGDGRLHPYSAGRFGSGANMAFPAGVLREIGGFDPATGAGTRARGGDDLCAFFAVLDAGHRVVYEPAAVVHHRYHRGVDATRAVAYGYGVGLGAYVAKTVIDRPGRVLEILPRLPAGLARGVRMRRGDPAATGARCPARLRALEGLGIVVGPVAYVASRRAVRRAGPARSATGA